MQEAVIKKNSQKNKLVISLFVLVALMLIAEGAIVLLRKPLVDNPGNSNGGTSANTLPAPKAATGTGVPTALNMGMPGAPTSMTDLQVPPSALVGVHEKHFTLTAQPARLTLGSGAAINAWTFNGTAPGPTLRVQQGALVIVTLVNHLSFGVTIHWHGVSVPNSEDGVAGVTQDAVKPGQSYTYRFIAKDAGTYWYHSHQFSYEETTEGLYGMLIVDPLRPTVHDDVDYSVALHDWNEAANQPLLTINDRTGSIHEDAQAGQWVRLRIVNTSSSQHLVTLVGAPFQVVALDGHDINGPQLLTQTPLPIGAAQRYDLRFQMPVQHTVALVTSLDNQHYQASPSVVIGQESGPIALPLASQHWFDMTMYGVPAADAINIHSHFDATYSITLSNQMGSSLGRMGMVYTMNGKVFPNRGMIMVQEGQLVRLHLDNQSDLIHPIHLHGHVFTVLTHNGHVLSGSPIHLDTVNIQPHDSYDIAFVANNPGLWMLHCHNLLHANWGMDMMVMYNVSTPYTVGSASGNFPD